MRPLIAIETCHALRHRANAQRMTWVAEAKAKNLEVDIKFFLGRGPGDPATDEVFLDVDDGYEGLPAKSQAIFKWSRAQGYENVLKVDDDVYLVAERALAMNYRTRQYSGRRRGCSGRWAAPYASGFAYWVGPQAMDMVIAAPLDTHDAEDRFVGNVLFEAGLHCYPEFRFVITQSKENKNAVSSIEGPRKGNFLVAAGEYHSNELMDQIHQEWLNSRSSVRTPPVSTGPLDRICILIKTFLRDGYLMNTITGIQKNLPECKMIIVDDGYDTKQKITVYAALREMGHECVWMAYDSGFGAKSNEAIFYMDRPYVLIASDDFNFNDAAVRPGIEKLLTVLDKGPQDIALVSGRVDNNPYEGYIERGPTWIKEVRLPETDYDEVAGVKYKLCDLTVNYSMIRTSVLGMDKVHWHAQWKIGGDHFQFFDDMKKAGHKIAFVPGVNIDQQPFNRRLMLPQYPEMRGRAKLALPGFFKMQNITEYIGFDGRVDRVPPT